MSLHKKALAFIKQNPFVRRFEIAKHLGIKDHRATYILDDLIHSQDIFQCQLTGGYFANEDLSELMTITNSVFINRKYA